MIDFLLITHSSANQRTRAIRRSPWLEGAPTAWKARRCRGVATPCGARGRGLALPPAHRGITIRARRVIGTFGPDSIPNLTPGSKRGWRHSANSRTIWLQSSNGRIHQTLATIGPTRNVRRLRPNSRNRKPKTPRSHRGNWVVKQKTSDSRFSRGLKLISQ
jgi:hypothetical protein